MPTMCIKCGKITVRFSGLRCSGCTSELFFKGREKMNLTEVEKSQFELHQYGEFF